MFFQDLKMENKFENDEDIKTNIINSENEDKKSIKKENPFIYFMENYYGLFKQFVEKKEISNIGKINEKLMSLVIIDIGHNLYLVKNEKEEKMREIINNSSYHNEKKGNITDKTSVKDFLNSLYMKKLFTYLKRREYIEAFKSNEPTMNNKLLEIYKLFYIIINNEKMVSLFDNSKERFWKKMTDEFVRKSFDGENLNKFIYKLLLDNLSFEPNKVFKTYYFWKKYFDNKYDIKDITGDSPTTGIFFLIIKEYLEWCGIIESRKSNQFILCNILKLDILNIDEKLIKTAKFYNKLNKENDP